MNCRAAMDRIIESAGRPLGPELENHVRACGACAQLRDEQLALWRRLDDWQAPEPSPGFEARLLRRLEGRDTVWSRLARWLGPVPPAFAGALACLLLVAGVVLERTRPAPAPSEPTVAVQNWDREDLRQMDTALDDMKMLNDFEILPVGPGEEGKS